MLALRWIQTSNFNKERDFSFIILGKINLARKQNRGLILVRMTLNIGENLVRYLLGRCLLWRKVSGSVRWGKSYSSVPWESWSDSISFKSFLSILKKKNNKEGTYRVTPETTGDKTARWFLSMKSSSSEPILEMFWFIETDNAQNRYFPQTAFANLVHLEPKR